jgi:hypothetical protein
VVEDVLPLPKSNFFRMGNVGQKRKKKERQYQKNMNVIPSL